MKTSLKIALLASVLMATPVLAAQLDTNDTHATNPSGSAVTNANNEKLDANGNPVHHKHWRHHHRDNSDASMNDPKYVNHDANPNYAAEDAHRGYRDANGNWHHNGEYARNNGSYRDANGNWHNGMGRDYAYNERTADGHWMGMDFNSRHMTDGADTDVNNRGRHAFIFGDNQNPQDFRVGSGHVVKF